MLFEDKRVIFNLGSLKNRLYSLSQFSNRDTGATMRYGLWPGYILECQSIKYNICNVLPKPMSSAIKQPLTLF